MHKKIIDENKWIMSLKQSYASLSGINLINPAEQTNQVKIRCLGESVTASYFVKS